jgi:hypothetical protein
MAKKTTTRYRDRESGRFVSKATWRRSRAHGGTKFRRERTRRIKRRKPPLKVRPRALPTPEEIEREIAREEEEEEIEYAGAFDSP